MSSYSKKRGLPPGSLVFTGTKKTSEISIEEIEYNQTNYSRKEIKNIKNINYSAGSDNIYWININGLHETNIIESIGNIFSINALTLEDILNLQQRPKTEIFGDYIYITLKMLTYNGDSIDNEQISIVLGKNYVITFQEKPGDIFDPLRLRIQSQSGKIRSSGSDYLAYALIDIVVDNYFVLLEKLNSEIEVFEENLIYSFEKETLTQIYRLKRENLVMRNSIWPVRELISQLERSESDLLNDRIQIYFRDLYDHTIQVIDTAEVSREILSGLIDLYLSGISNKTNEVMKVLTIISTIFIPLTFIVGLYGMNFKFMPELSWKWGYIAVWAIMLLITFFMIIYIKRKKWL
ncbi:MAG: magnesium/cobalt transporter CorA [Bacteroidales bacterium]|jgi:magnesium transporter|nr:magnesium/cobalt transporter CorA [Bacteroidales bacterium]